MSKTRAMTPVVKDYMLASADSVAIDAVAAKMMGFDPMRLDYIRLAHEDGLGVGRPEEIEVVGEDVSQVDFGFEVGFNLTRAVGGLFWFTPARFMQRLLFHTPLVYAFIFASFAYHDYVWWPLRGRAIQKRVRKETSWGRLFEEYPE